MVILVLERIQSAVCVHACDGDAACPGCNLIDCSAQSFGVGGKKTSVKPYTVDRIGIFTKEELLCCQDFDKQAD